MKSLHELNKQTRDASNDGLRRTYEVRSIDASARTVDLAFSSEIDYQRWWGIEQLGHGADEVDLSRLQNSAALLVDHDRKDQVGVVENARIDADGKGRATVRFGKSARAQEIFQDVQDGIRKLVSVGYLVRDAKLIDTRDGLDVYRITDWQPYEISIVSVPADVTVGVGRSSEIPSEDSLKQTLETSTIVINPPKASTAMKETITRDSRGNKVRAMVDDSGKIVEVLEVMEVAGQADMARDAEKRGRETEQARVKAITDLGRTYNDSELASQFVADGKTAEDFQRELLFKFGKERSAKPIEEQVTKANIGLNDKEVRSFSILRAIRAMLPDASKADRDAAAFEMEVSRAAAVAYDKQPKGILIPSDVLAYRAFSTVTGNGAAAIATNLLAGSFIDILRKKAWVLGRARSLAGLVGNVDIPRQNATTQAYWLGEGNSPTAGTPGLDQISLTPKTIGAFTDVTRRLLKQSTPDAEAIVRDDILKVIALELDRVMIYGTGSENMPKGVNNYSGINAVTFGSQGGSSGKPSYNELVQMETEIALDNADVDDMSYAFNAQIRGNLKTTLKAPTVNGSAFIWEEPGDTVNGYATDVSNQVNTGDVFFGNWKDLIVALWGGLEVTVDPYALSTSGGLRIIALQEVDANIRHPESFCVGR